MYVSYVYIYTHVLIPLCTCVSVYACAYMWIYIHIHIRTHIHTYTHTYIHSYIHTYIQTYKHTDIQSVPSGNNLTVFRDTAMKFDGWSWGLPPLFWSLPEFNKTIIRDSAEAQTSRTTLAQHHAERERERVRARGHKNTTKHKIGIGTGIRPYIGPWGKSKIACPVWPEHCQAWLRSTPASAKVRFRV